jgi:glycosyltransferase involved in cell wall biosynthesis
MLGASVHGLPSAVFAPTGSFPLRPLRRQSLQFYINIDPEADALLRINAKNRPAQGCRSGGGPPSGRGGLKIGLSTNAFGHGGGIERYVRDLAGGLAVRGVESHVFTRRFDTSLPESRLVTPHVIGASFLPGKLRDHWFSWRLREARRRAGIDVMIACNRVDSADIGVCGGTHIGFLRATGRRPALADRWQIALERRYYANAKVIVAHSKLMADELKELYGVPESKICVLYPPTDGTRFTPADGERRRALREKYGWADGEIVLLFPSSGHERKGLPAIERALEGINLPVVLAIAGRAPGRTLERTSGRVRWLGFVQQIEECYQAADFTILASRYEPFGMVGAETVMCGTPAILSSRVGALEVIAPRAKFTFDPEDVAGLRDAIARAVRSLGDGPSTEPGARSRVSRADLLYNPEVDHHVDSLLHMAQRIHDGGNGAGR